MSQLSDLVAHSSTSENIIIYDFSFILSKFYTECCRIAKKICRAGQEKIWSIRFYNNTKKLKRNWLYFPLRNCQNKTRCVANCVIFTVYILSLTISRTQSARDNSDSYSKILTIAGMPVCGVSSFTRTSV